MQISRQVYKSIAIIILTLTFSSITFALNNSATNLRATNTLEGLLALFIFLFTYILVTIEEVISLKKSKPVMFAAGLIWILVSSVGITKNQNIEVTDSVRNIFLEYTELLLFILVAITYVNTLEERNVFKALRSWLISKGLTFRQCYWVVSLLAFFISPIADNLTTALLMGAVVTALGHNNPKFIALCYICIVVSVNAGGAFSPFGDITTLMVWQKKKLMIDEFFKLFIPSLLSFLIPASIMHFAVPKNLPSPLQEKTKMKYGAITIMFLFVLTILTAISFHKFLNLPPTIGMMTGLSYLLLYSNYLQRSHKSIRKNVIHKEIEPFDVFDKIQNVEWDTLLFFYGVMLCVGGLSTLGFLELISTLSYQDLGASLSLFHQATPANIAVGIISSIVDNIPVMFTILSMDPIMPKGQWLLVTLTAAIGGSLLSIGSAAGVALMGQSKGSYTFLTHLKWSWSILLGYIAAVVSHIWLNSDTFYKF